MRIWLVSRKHDNVFVTILKNKSDNTYSFVNITKEHICSCRFKSVAEALNDMDKQICEKKILKYYELKEIDFDKVLYERSMTILDKRRNS